MSVISDHFKMQDWFLLNFLFFNNPELTSRTQCHKRQKNDLMLTPHSAAHNNA